MSNGETQEGFSTQTTENENCLSQLGSATMSQDISAFGRVKVDIGRCLTKPVISEVALMLTRFTNSLRDDLDRSDNPSAVFVKCSVDMGYITAQGACAVTDALEYIGFKGPAEAIRAIYEKYKKELEAETKNNEGDSMLSQEEQNSEVSHTPKRKRDVFFIEEKDVPLEGAAEGSSFDELQRGKVAKLTSHNFTEVTAQESQFVFIQQLLHPVFSESNKCRVLCIGTALVKCDNLPRPKLLFVSNKTGEIITKGSEKFFKVKSGSNIREKKCYNLSNCYSVTDGINEGILIGPEAEVSMMSRHLPQFSWIKDKTLEPSEPFISSAPEYFDICLPVFTVPRVKYSIPPGQTIFIISGVIKERIETHFRHSPRILFKLIDDTSREFVDVSVFKKDLNIAWSELLQEDNCVTLRYFKTHRSEKFKSGTNMLIGTQNSDVELLDNAELDVLKKFDLGLSEAGVVMTVNPVRPYVACRQCYKKVDEENRCPTCGKMFSQEDLAGQFFLQLEILLSENQQIIDGVVFKESVIDALRNYDPKTQTDIDEDVDLLDNLLIDKNVKFVYREHEEMNNVFTKLKILGDAD